MKKFRNFGFTLVELMVVVAIIGILAAVGIPSFQKYQAKSKTTEAKVHLAAGYTAMTSFQAEYDVYANCLPVMGYNPTPEASSRYYFVGVQSMSGPPYPNELARNNGASDTCIDITLAVSDLGTSWFWADKGTPGYSVNDYVGGIALEGFSFQARGFISPSPPNNGCSDVGADSWTINENKSVSHDCVGY